MNQDKMTASEALFGFCAWITTREQSVCAGSNHECGVWADLIQKFCDTNELSEPRDSWSDSLFYPTEQKTITKSKETFDEFKSELQVLINKNSIENFCDMPDFLLAELLCNLILTIGTSTKKTLNWHSIDSICHPNQPIGDNL